MKYLLVVVALMCATVAHAETPKQIRDAYAKAAGPGFTASALRGGQFFTKNFAVSETMPSCSTCHTENPTQPGNHAITHKTIKPMAPSANDARFSDSAKVEKWFTRNCKEVVGRECAADEKADFITFLMESH